MSPQTDRDALKAILDAELEVQGHAILGLGYFLAGAAVQAGWRPPAQVIETPEELEALQGGTVIRSRHGDIGSIDHGGDGEWLGPSTVVHFLDFATASRMTVAEIAVELPESFPWTVLYATTERPNQ